MATTTLAPLADIDADVAAIRAEVGRCTCHDVIEGSSGSFSYAGLGVECGPCQSLDHALDAIDSWNAMTQDERRADVASTLAFRWARTLERFSDRTLRGRRVSYVWF